MGKAPRAANGGDQHSSEPLATAIKREAIGYVAKAVIATAAGIIGVAGLGLWIYAKQFLPEIAGGVPHGAVMAFDRDDLTDSSCPPGWRPFLEARARTIIGAGDPALAPGDNAVDDSGKKLLGYVLRQHGGYQRFIGGPDRGELLPVRPIADLVPFIALYYCKKD
jgi:hypothetical protein